MEGTPEGLDYEKVEDAMRATNGVRGVHDLHIWAISSADLALSAHVEIDDAAVSEAGLILASLKEMLLHDYSLTHVTLEMEPFGGACAGSSCPMFPGHAARHPEGH